MSKSITGNPAEERLALQATDPDALFARFGTSFEAYWQWRVARHGELKIERDAGAAQKLNHIKTSTKPFVVLQAVNDRARLREQRQEGIEFARNWRLTNTPAQNCFFVNNTGAHWDLTRIGAGADQFIASSGADLACGCYTLVNIVAKFYEHIDKDILDRILGNFEIADRRKIEDILQNGGNSSSLEPALVRRFTSTVILNLPESDGRSEIAANIVRPLYQLATEEITMALEALGIDHIEQTALGQIDRVSDEARQQNIKLNILGANADRALQEQIFDENDGVYCFLKTHLDPANNAQLLETIFAMGKVAAQDQDFINFATYCELLKLEKGNFLDGDDNIYYAFISNDGENYLIPKNTDVTSKIYRSNPDSEGLEELEKDAYPNLYLKLEDSASNILAEEGREVIVQPVVTKPDPKTVTKTVVTKPDPKTAAVNPAIATSTFAPHRRAKPATKPAVTKTDPKPATAKPKATPLSAESQITNIIKAILNPEHHKDEKVQPNVKKAFDDFISAQNKEINPTTPYHGLGIKGAIIKFGGKISFEMEDIFDKSLARFSFVKSRTPITDVDQELKGKIITKIGDMDIDKIANRYSRNIENPDFLSEIASLFHGSGAISFTIADKISGVESVVSCNRNVFVTKSCTTCVGKLAAEEGARYNPEQHGIDPSLSALITKAQPVKGK